MEIVSHGSPVNGLTQIEPQFSTNGDLKGQ